MTKTKHNQALSEFFRCFDVRHMTQSLPQMNTSLLKTWCFLWQVLWPQHWQCAHHRRPLCRGHWSPYTVKVSLNLSHLFGELCFFLLCIYLSVFVLCAQVSGSEEEVHHRTEGAPAKRAESLRSPKHHQSHHGNEVLPGQNVSRGGFRGFFSVHAGKLHSFIYARFFPPQCIYSKRGWCVRLLNCTGRFCFTAGPLFELSSSP